MNVWVFTDGWAGRMRHPGVLIKRNPKRSRVLFKGRERLVPNHAIEERTPLNSGCGVLDDGWECNCGQCGSASDRESAP